MFSTYSVEERCKMKGGENFCKVPSLEGYYRVARGSVAEGS